MRFRKLYRFETRVGLFYIATSEDGRFHPLFKDESLGSYFNATQALDDLVGGHTFSAGSGIDTSALDLPHDLAEWEALVKGH